MLTRLQVVDQLPGQVFRCIEAQPKRIGDGRDQLVRRERGFKGGKQRAGCKTGRCGAGHGQREAGFTHATRPDEREQPAMRVGKQGSDRLQLAAAAEKGRGLCGQGSHQGIFTEEQVSAIIARSGEAQAFRENRSAERALAFAASVARSLGGAAVCSDFEQAARHDRNGVDCGFEGGLVGLRGLVHAADFADVLKGRGADLVLTGRRLEVVERANVAAHELTPLRPSRQRRRRRSAARGFPVSSPQ